jgi:hypothetical protein
MVAQRQCWIGRDGYHVVKKSVVIQFDAWLSCIIRQVAPMKMVRPEV